MAKTLTEMAADIVTAQAGVTRMSTEELAEALTKTYQSLRKVQDLEEGVAPETPAPCQLVLFRRARTDRSSFDIERGLTYQEVAGSFHH